MGPVIGLAGTTALIELLLVTVKSDAATPLKPILEASTKLVPRIVTLAPGAALVGVKLVILAGR